MCITRLTYRTWFYPENSLSTFSQNLSIPPDIEELRNDNKARICNAHLRQISGLTPVRFLQEMSTALSGYVLGNDMHISRTPKIKSRPQLENLIYSIII